MAERYIRRTALFLWAVTWSRDIELRSDKIRIGKVGTVELEVAYYVVPEIGKKVGAGRSASVFEVPIHGGVTGIAFDRPSNLAQARFPVLIRKVVPMQVRNDESEESTKQ